jgi:hypothetical protein
MSRRLPAGENRWLENLRRSLGEPRGYRGPQLAVVPVMPRPVALALVLLAACTEPAENPVVVREVTASCGPIKRLVTDACTKLGSNDACTDVDDVCIALCDGRTSCADAGGLRVLSPWAVAPNGYCVECSDPQ